MLTPGAALILAGADTTAVSSPGSRGSGEGRRRRLRAPVISTALEDLVEAAELTTSGLLLARRMRAWRARVEKPRPAHGRALQRLTPSEPPRVVSTARVPGRGRAWGRAGSRARRVPPSGRRLPRRGCAHGVRTRPSARQRSRHLYRPRPAPRRLRASRTRHPRGSSLPHPHRSRPAAHDQPPPKPRSGAHTLAGSPSGNLRRPAASIRELRRHATHGATATRDLARLGRSRCASSGRWIDPCGETQLGITQAKATCMSTQEWRSARSRRRPVAPRVVRRVVPAVVLEVASCRSGKARPPLLRRRRSRRPGAPPVPTGHTRRRRPTHVGLRRPRRRPGRRPSLAGHRRTTR